MGCCLKRPRFVSPVEVYPGTSNQEFQNIYSPVPELLEISLDGHMPNHLQGSNEQRKLYLQRPPQVQIYTQNQNCKRPHNDYSLPVKKRQCK